MPFIFIKSQLNDCQVLFPVYAVAVLAFNSEWPNRTAQYNILKNIFLSILISPDLVLFEESHRATRLD